MKPHAHPDGEDKPRLRLMPRRLGHVNLFVSDLEQSMAFYENVAGFHEIFREADIQAGFLSNGNTHHDFGLIQTLSDQYIATQWTNAVIFGILVAILVFRPSGLLGEDVGQKA